MTPEGTSDFDTKSEHGDTTQQSGSKAGPLLQLFATSELESGDATYDVSDMKRLGKKQEFKRNFGFLSTLGFISIFMATWEFVLVLVASLKLFCCTVRWLRSRSSLSVGLVNGGFGGLFWVFIGTTTCYASIVASLAEMESMAPTSGGQYHWVSEFSPPEYQKFASYAAGWMSTLAWLASVASSLFVVATLIENMINLTNSSFAFPNWQYTLIMLACLVLTIGLNTWGAPVLPMVETISLFGHIGGFTIFVVLLWVFAPKNPAHAVFAEVVNSGGWSNTGTSCLVAQVTILYCNLGSDTAVHISEEVEDASLVVPRCMWWSYLGNLFMGIIMLITMLFCIGDLSVVLDSPTPYLVLMQNTGSFGVALALSVILFVLIFSGNITALATTSREMWAFSRDRGFPCSRWISRMNYKRNVPENSVYLTSIISALICLIDLGSTTGFNIVVSLNILAILSTYMVSIGFVLLKRIRGQDLPPARWSLGRWGLPINAFAFAYSGFVIVFSCFPNTVPVSAGTANWAPLVWAGVILIALAAYLLHGRRFYTAPVIFVEGRKQAGVGLQST